MLRQFRLIYGFVRQQFRDIEANCELSGSQLWMRATPGVGVTELALRLSIHQTTCSHLGERLCSRGYIVKVRSTYDQRRREGRCGISSSRTGNESSAP